MNFNLKPFGAQDPAFPFAVTGTIGRRADAFSICYVLRGPLEGLILPEPAEACRRAEGLWRSTCFEAFLAAAGSPRYWEFNLSPSGRWNAYRFECYRQGMTEERAFASLPVTLSRGPDSLALALTVDLGSIIGPGCTLEVAVSAVTEETGGRLTYWALVHRGPHPDFHRRDSFVITLKG